MKGFFAGALTAAPITALIMWYVVGWQGLVDARIDRAETRGELERAKHTQQFDQRFAQMAGEGCPQNDALAQRVAELQTRLKEQEAVLSTSGQEVAGQRDVISEIVEGKETDND